MLDKSTFPLGFLGLVAALGCASATPTQRAATAPHAPVDRERAAEPEPPRSAEATLTEADQLSRSQWGATRAGQFELDRQVFELRRAVMLYQQFLDLADGRPELEPAVRKSRQAIADLQDTLKFLLAREGEGKEQGQR